ncbi:MAG: glycerophosphodiester phosphodiesterase [Planctomycetaceae bacterium]|nr:glycerophosphodiester phosphodiesterase [Planctomycetaceae bacterium]
MSRTDCNRTHFAGRRWLMIAVAAVGATGARALPAGELNVEIVGHRGASFDAPENTLSALRLGWEQGADAVEFDVWLSKDGQIVLHHDKDAQRTAGVDRRIDEQTYAELKQLDVGRWKDPKYAGEPIPLLSAALATIPAGKRVFIEVKCGPEIVPELGRVLAAAKRPVEATAVISFSSAVCAACSEAFPDRKVYWIVALKQDPQTGAWNHTAGELIADALKLGVDGLDLQACALIDKAFGDAVLQQKLELLVWTVNDAALARQMIAAGVQGITTDRPGWLREQLAP